MTIIKNALLTITALIALGGFQAASAVAISNSLGNTTPGFNDGDTPAVFVVGGAQSGQPVPFDTGYGTDGLFGGNFDQNWTHNYGAILGPIQSASITIGIYDHDSSASGSQLSAFSIDGNDLTSSLDTLFETAGDGLDNMYNVYTINLGAALFASLADGSALVALALMGPGQVPDLFGGGISETNTNGANLIFSTLDIEYRDPNLPPIPVPAAAPLFLTAIAAFGLYRRRVLRNQA